MSSLYSDRAIGAALAAYEAALRNLNGFVRTAFDSGEIGVTIRFPLTEEEIEAAVQAEAKYMEGLYKKRPALRSKL